MMESVGRCAILACGQLLNDILWSVRIHRPKLLEQKSVRYKARDKTSLATSKLEFQQRTEDVSA